MKYLILLFVLANASIVFAQPADSLRKINFSGYVQMQYQLADSAGIASYSGGDFPVNTDNRFIFRRARIKPSYQYKNFQLVAQFDFSPTNIAVVDAYLRVIPKELPFLTVQVGLADRAWGFETSYSSRVRESPERSRVYQTLLPGERDLGTTLFIQPLSGFLKKTKLSLALVNGSGRVANDFDSFKDFIGSYQISDIKIGEQVNIGLGFSHYRGGIRQESFVTFREGITSNGLKGFRGDTSASNVGIFIRRLYTGANTQISLKTPIGESKLMAEYIGGAQPGTIPSSVLNGPAASRSFSTQPFTDIYIRNFEGYYIAYAQSFKGSKWRSILKYDVYDPNTFVKGKEISSGITNLSSADIAYKTLGLGFLYNPTDQLQCTFYYEWVKNESTQLPKFKTDISDNVFTFRIQYSLK